MKYIAAIAPGLFLTILISCQYNTREEPPQNTTDDSPEVSFYTSDSITVYGDLYETDKKATTILLFHQAGSNARGEYEAIIPRLIKEGYNVLAIDQRSGGQLHGSYNRTVAQFSNPDYSYCDAYPDLESALDYMIHQGFSGNKIVWGSSYSAALAIQLAGKRPDAVAAVLAFSPASGGPMKECSPDVYFETLKTPMLLLRPQQEMEVESVKTQFDLAVQNGHKTFIAEKGKHGSSMLVKARTGEDVDATWKAVLSFIRTIKNS